MTKVAIRRAELAAELGSSASSATLRNLVAELEFTCKINGLVKFRKFRSETLRNLVAELENIIRIQWLNGAWQVPHRTTPLWGVCVRVRKTRAHHTRGAVGRARDPPLDDPPNHPGGRSRQAPPRTMPTSP